MAKGRIPKKLAVSKGADASAAVPAVAAATPVLPTGYFDGCIDNFLCGWFLDGADHSHHYSIEFLLDDKVLGTTACTRVRPDLRDFGFGDGSFGFQWLLPSSIGIGQVPAIKARVVGTGIILDGSARPLYSSLAATSCCDGEVVVDWPNSLSGLLIGAGAGLPATLDLLLGKDLCFQIGLEPCMPPSGVAGIAARFQWQLPQFFKEIPLGSAAFRFPEGQLLELWRLPQRESLSPSRELHGKVEVADVDTVSGWACDPDSPEEPLLLALKIDGAVVATALANRFAARLRNESRSGSHGFSFEVPQHCFNGHVRNLAVEVLKYGIELPSVRRRLSFPLVANTQLTKAGSLETATRYDPFSHDKRFAARRQRAIVAEGKVRGKPVVSLLMLNWNGLALLKDFFASLAAVSPGTPFELIVVDHGSTDGSLQYLKKQGAHWPLTVIARGENRSFSESNNLAAKTAKGRYLLFINNDMVLQRDCIAEMLALLADPAVGIVGTQLVEPLKSDLMSWSLLPHHQGVRFRPQLMPAGSLRYYAPHEVVDVPAELTGTAVEMPAVTAALMMCRKDEFLAVGGFCEGFVYGMEDVDFCLAYARKFGKKIVSLQQASAIHNRSATRDLKITKTPAPDSYTKESHLANRLLYLKRHGRLLTGEIMRSLLAGSTFWRQRPLRVTFVVTEVNRFSSYGDFYTAFELGNCLQQEFGWDVCYTHYKSHEIPGTDVLIAMRFDYDIRLLNRGNPGLVTIAWIRNRADEWVARPEFGGYQIVLASSHKIADYVNEKVGKKAVYFPIATNPDLFSPEGNDKHFASDVVFTGNSHSERNALSLLAPSGKEFTFAHYGHLSKPDDKYARFHRGALAYDDVAKAYASAKLVLDDSQPVTRDWNSLNSRVFDAIACGKLVLTNCVEGARELFGNRLPVFTTAKELKQQVSSWLKQEGKRNKLAAELRKHVLAHHTYSHRAATLRKTLQAHLAPGVLRISIKVPIPRESEQQQWGDYHFALGIKRAFEKQGHVVRLDLLPHWDGGLGMADDVVLVLRGLSRYQPKPSAVNILWLISHPDKVEAEELQQYDHVFVASESYTRKLKPLLGDKVSCLLQCTDPAIFHPDSAAKLQLPPVLFVGNSRGQRREVVEHALASKAPLAVFGSGWAGQVPATMLRGEYVPNEELRHYYSTAAVVLNDHWPDMRREGFLSNRLFDAGACGAVILSDAAEGLAEVFGTSITTYDSAASFGKHLQTLLTDAAQRRRVSTAVRKAVLASHTFDHRISRILDRVKNLRTPP